MAKPTRHAGLICFILTLVAAAGVGIGIWQNISVIALLGLLPAVVYEAWRTEGASTKLASIGMLLVVLALLVLIVAKISLDLTPYLAGLGLEMALDVKLVGPLVVALLALILLRRTAGIYTRWLAVVILLSAAGLFVILEPALLDFLLEERIGLR